MRSQSDPSGTGFPHQILEQIVIIYVPQMVEEIVEETVSGPDHFPVSCIIKGIVGRIVDVTVVQRQIPTNGDSTSTVP